MSVLPDNLPGATSTGTKAAKAAKRGRMVQPAAENPSAQGDVVARANRWRSTYDPLRGLTIAKAVTHRESWVRGEMADVQWAYLWVEMADPDVFALRELRAAAIGEMEWHIQTVSDTTAGFNLALAEKQQAALGEAYERVDNLTEAIEHLCTAAFRGFAHLEKWRASDNTITHLEPVDQWNVVRDGLRGAWKYNPRAVNTTFVGLQTTAEEGQLMDAGQFLCLHCDRHIDFYALPKFCRSGLAEKDWTAFIEIYGLPSGVVIQGPNSNPANAKKEAEDAGKIAEGGSGALPFGASYTPNDSPRGTDPFTPFLKYLTEKTILVGTGGKLTMLAESGSGTLAGSAHADTFTKIAKGEARRINELFQRGLDAEILEAAFPGQPHLAYFELDYQQDADPAIVVEQAVKLATAGYRIPVDELSEKTGFEIVEGPPPAAPAENSASPTPGQSRNASLQSSAMALAASNRADGVKVSPNASAGILKAFGQTQADALRTLRIAIAAIAQLPESDQPAALGELRNRLPRLLRELNATPATAAVIERGLATEWVRGLVADAPTAISATGSRKENQA